MTETAEMPAETPPVEGPAPQPEAPPEPQPESQPEAPPEPEIAEAGQEAEAAVPKERQEEELAVLAQALMGEALNEGDANAPHVQLIAKLYELQITDQVPEDAVLYEEGHEITVGNSTLAEIVSIKGDVFTCKTIGGKLVKVSRGALNNRAMVAYQETLLSGFEGAERELLEQFMKSVSDSGEISIPEDLHESVDQNIEAVAAGLNIPSVGEYQTAVENFFPDENVPEGATENQKAKIEKFNKAQAQKRKRLLKRAKGKNLTDAEDWIELWREARVDMDPLKTELEQAQSNITMLERRIRAGKKDGFYTDESGNTRQATSDLIEKWEEQLAEAEATVQMLQESTSLGERFKNAIAKKLGREVNLEIAQNLAPEHIIKTYFERLHGGQINQAEAHAMLEVFKTGDVEALIEQEGIRDEIKAKAKSIAKWRKFAERAGLWKGRGEKTIAGVLALLLLMAMFAGKEK